MSGVALAEAVVASGLAAVGVAFQGWRHLVAAALARRQRGAKMRG